MTNKNDAIKRALAREEKLREKNVQVGTIGALRNFIDETNSAPTRHPGSMDLDISMAITVLRAFASFIPDNAEDHARETAADVALKFAADVALKFAPAGTDPRAFFYHAEMLRKHGLLSSEKKSGQMRKITPQGIALVTSLGPSKSEIPEEKGQNEQTISLPLLPIASNIIVIADPTNNKNNAIAQSSKPVELMQWALDGLKAEAYEITISQYVDDERPAIFSDAKGKHYSAALSGKHMAIIKEPRLLMAIATIKTLDSLECDINRKQNQLPLSCELLQASIPEKILRNQTDKPYQFEQLFSETLNQLKKMGIVSEDKNGDFNLTKDGHKTLFTFEEFGDASKIGMFIDSINQSLLKSNHVLDFIESQAVMIGSPAKSNKPSEKLDDVSPSSLEPQVATTQETPRKSASFVERQVQSRRTFPGDTPPVSSI